MSLGEGSEAAKMEASQLLQTYQIRKAGYEDGLLKYPPALYEAVCTLVDALGRLPSDEEIRLHFDVGDAVFVVARTGVALASLPIGEVENISGGDAG